MIKILYMTTRFKVLKLTALSRSTSLQLNAVISLEWVDFAEEFCCFCWIPNSDFQSLPAWKDENNEGKAWILSTHFILYGIWIHTQVEMSGSAFWLWDQGSGLDISSFQLDINWNIYSATSADLIVFTWRVIGGQPQLDGCQGNTAFKSGNGLQWMSLTQCALAILLNPLDIDWPLNLT